MPSRPQSRSPHARRPRPADPPSASEGVKGYSTRQVAEVLGLTTSRILSWTRRGLISPTRGPGGAFIFSFQDLLLLRTARELLDADVSTRRIQESLDALRDQLPVGRPLSAVTISAVGDKVLVQDDQGLWEPNSGQMQIAFATQVDVAEKSQVDRFDARRHESAVPDEAHGPLSADHFYNDAVDFEADDPSAAITAYRAAIAIDPAHSEAHLNLGRLLHEGGRVDEAADEYRLAIDADPDSARARYNLGVVLEDQGDRTGAIAAYEAAVRLEESLAVAHFNLSRLLESEGLRTEALQHLAAYKQLIDQGERGG